MVMAHSATIRSAGRSFRQPASPSFGVEERAALTHQLRDQRERVLWLFPDECPKTRRTEKECLTFFVGARVSGVARVLRQAFGSECFSGRGNPGHEASPCPNPTPKHDAPTNDHEQPIRSRAPLINCEGSGPCRASRVRCQRFSLGFTEPCDPSIGLLHSYPHIPQRLCRVAMSGPLLTVLFSEPQLMVLVSVRPMAVFAPM